MFCIQGYSRQCKNCKLIEAKTIHGQAVTFCYIWGKTLINEKKPRTGLRLMGWERHRWLRFWGNCPIKSEISNQKRKSKKSWGQGWGWWDGSTAAARAITFSTQLGQSQPCTEFSLSPPSQRWGVSKNISLQTICCENKKNELCLIRSQSGQLVMICVSICFWLYSTKSSIEPSWYSRKGVHYCSSRIFPQRCEEFARLCQHRSSTSLNKAQVLQFYM